MVAIEFTTPFEKNVVSGLDRCVIYTYNDYEPWFGIVSIDSNQTDGEITTTYLDGAGNRFQTTLTGFEANAVCYNFPEAIETQDFGMCYRVYTNESLSEYELHLVYGCSAKIDSLNFVTLTRDPNIQYFSFDISTTPKYIPIKGYQPGSHLIIRTDKLWKEAIFEIESKLYGSDEEDPRLPSIEEVIEILERFVDLRITDHGDGSWTAEEINKTGIISMIDSTTFEIDWDSGRFIDDEIYTIHSL